MRTKADIAKDALNRITKIEADHPVTNICAGEFNPTRLAYFVALVVKQHRNKYGVLHTERWARCTDKKGKSWNVGMEVIYPGHIDYAECRKMFETIHAVMFA